MKRIVKFEVVGYNKNRTLINAQCLLIIGQELHKILFGGFIVDLPDIQICDKYILEDILANPEYSLSFFVELVKSMEKPDSIVTFYNDDDIFGSSVFIVNEYIQRKVIESFN